MRQQTYVEFVGLLSRLAVEVLPTFVERAADVVLIVNLVLMKCSVIFKIDVADLTPAIVLFVFMFVKFYLVREPFRAVIVRAWE